MWPSPTGVGVPAALSAIGLSTVAELLAAISGSVAAMIAFYLLMLERQRRREERRESRRRIARQVAAWGEAPRDGHAAYRVFVRNASDEPVYDCRAEIGGLVSENDMHGPPPLSLWCVGVVPPAATRELDCGTALCENPIGPSVRIQFADPAEHLWERNVSGELRELKEGFTIDIE